MEAWLLSQLVGFVAGVFSIFASVCASVGSCHCLIVCLEGGVQGGGGGGGGGMDGDVLEEWLCMPTQTMSTVTTSADTYASRGQDISCELITHSDILACILTHRHTQAHTHTHTQAHRHTHTQAHTPLPD